MHLSLSHAEAGQTSLGKTVVAECVSGLHSLDHESLELLPGMFSAEEFDLVLGLLLEPHGARTGANVHNSALLLNQGKESIDHALRAPKVGVKKILLGGLGGETNTSVVDDGVELVGSEVLLDSLGGGGDGVSDARVDQDEVDVVLVRGELSLDLSEGSRALLLAAGAQVDEAVVLREQLLAQCKPNTSVSTSHDNSFQA